jgi:hypothetical protein
MYQKMLHIIPEQVKINWIPVRKSKNMFKCTRKYSYYSDSRMGGHCVKKQ